MIFPASLLRGLCEGLLDRQGAVCRAQHTRCLSLRHSSWHASHGFQLVRDGCNNAHMRKLQLRTVLSCRARCHSLSRTPLYDNSFLTIYSLPSLSLDSFISRGREPWTLTNKTKDSQRTLPAKLFKEISYPKADGIISFDLLTSLSRSGMSCKKC